MIILLSLLACAMHRTGLVEVESGAPRLLDADGRHWRLVLDESTAPVAHLEGCTVDLSGRRAAGRLYVRDWQVLDAGDGSAPYVGVLERYGSHWIVDDRNSGTEVALDPDSLRGLDEWEGRIVLVVGYVVGTHEVRVVTWRVLEDVEGR